MTTDRMSEEPKPCPFCNDPMLYEHDVLKHATQSSACPISGYAWGGPMAIANWNRRSSPDREIAELREATLEEAAKVIEEGFEKAVGESYRNDGKPSKNDKCPHGRYHYEDCDQCCADAVRALKGSQP